MRAFMAGMFASLAVFAADIVRLPSGIDVSGTGVVATESSGLGLQRAATISAGVIGAFSVDAKGPVPIKVQIPSDMSHVDVYRRAADGLYVRVPGTALAEGGGTSFVVGYPGDYVLGASTGKQPSGDEKALFAPQALSEDPAAKAKWKLTRTAADTVDGPMPLILIHGLSTDFWAPFVAWASDSDEAADLRTHFQLWKFLSPNEGVNAAVGYNSSYPGFDESLAAYLNRFIVDAEQSGSEGTDGETYTFPEGPFCMLTHSQGGVTARAFLANFPDQAERCLGVVTLSGPHMGSPGASPEWVRYALAQLGPFQTQVFPQPLRGAFASFLLDSYLSTNRQSDMDMGWANFDAQGVGGIPTRNFRTWIPQHGFERRTLSARDGNQTGARNLPGYADTTFEPAELLPNYCGGMDEITPSKRGEMNMDKFFLYGAYLEPGDNWTELREQAERAYGGSDTGLYYDVALRLLSILMAQVETNGSHAPLGTFLLSDGFVPLQSELMLDGLEDKLIYKTRTVHGWTVPKRPFAPRMKLIRQHTLANPDRIRILRGWSHYDTVTGRYDETTKTSPLFPMVADDLLSVLP